MKKIIYAGTPDFAVEGLKQIINNTNMKLLLFTLSQIGPQDVGESWPQAP